ncbi:MAG: WbuC family cupin fold metalloprotein [Gammaproteobacteria bacterium]|nr:WbuC family cupin fold metalloprotein [Gammaproteobacteria bacterium]
MLKVISQSSLDELSRIATTMPRRRMNSNLHPDLNDSIHRFCNALEPCTYLPPHRHVGADRWELMTVLRGSVAVLIFNDLGTVIERLVLGPQEANYAIEIPGGTWHALTSLAAGTVILEIKHGPYIKVEGANLAAWAPAEGTPQADAMEQWMRTARVGACVPHF